MLNPDRAPVLDDADDLAIRSVTATIVDVPTVRRHKLSNTSVTAQNVVIVQVLLENGVEGIGEAATLGGPRWSEESVESIKATIDAYLAPALWGCRADRFEAAALRMAEAAKRNNAAKAAVETALFDAVGKSVGLPVHALLGGAVRDSFPVLWTLASGDPAQEIEEAEGKLAARLQRTFKVKIGAQAPEADLARLRRIAAALDGRATLIVDVNQGWDETTAVRYMPELAGIGVRLVEQPLPAWNIEGLARLRARGGVPPILADECVFDAHDMLAVAKAHAADAVSLKLVKHGGLLALRKVAAVAEAAGIANYGGCLLESSVGAAAHLHVFATLPSLAWGVEHFGPQILVDDLVTEPLVFSDFAVRLPDGPGLGLTLDADKIRRFARA
jgi:muconate cycloisomerase